MKQIITWISIFLVVFVVFIAGSFLFLTYGTTSAEPVELAAAKVNETAFAARMRVMNDEIDSLKSVIKNLQNQVFFAGVTVDSLNQQSGIKDAVIAGYDTELNTLRDQVKILTGRRTSVKDLAKTYESMKSEEMAPILDAVDDRTIIALYENMSSRTRKNIIQALPGVRAAEITKKLAGTAS